MHAGVDESSSEASAAEQAVKMARNGKGTTEDVFSALEAAEARHNRQQQGYTHPSFEGLELEPKPWLLLMHVFFLKT